MDKLRLKLLSKGYAIKLTQEENDPLKRDMVYTCQNSYWLMSSRGELDFTHPHYPGPFTIYNVLNYHIYCSLEKWIELGNDPQNHWNYKPFKPLKNFGYMRLSIVQRKRTWKVSKLGPEMFDELMPL